MKQKQAEMVSSLQNLAIELGRTPTREEFIQRTGGSRYHITSAWGTWIAMIHAAGLDPQANGHTKKIDNKIFEKDLFKHLEDYKPKESEKLDDPFPRIGIISDIHWPFHCQRVIDKFYRFIEREQPEYVIINGDARDYYSHAKFPRSHNQFTPKEENELGRKLNGEFWIEVLKAAPKAKRYQNLGNHDARPMKRIIEAYPEAEDWLVQAMEKEFTFNGVKTIHDPREELIIANIVIHHGFKSQLGAHRDHNLQNSISSHTHRPGVVYRTVRGQAIWELNTGYAGDPYSKGLSYIPTKTIDWVQSFGFVDQDGPRVIMG